MEIRPTVKADLVAFDYDMPYSARGITVVDDDGTLAAIAAVVYSEPVQAISRVTDAIKQKPREMVKAVRSFRQLMSRHFEIVYATPDPEEPTAHRFLTHVGFRTTDRRVYIWDGQQQQSD